MAKNPLPSVELLRQLLDYNPETGALVWLPRPPMMFSERGRLTQETKANAWNARLAGVSAGTQTPLGYMRLDIGSKGYMAHRVAWAHFYGCEPVGEIDHINGQKHDNRIENLRDVSPSINSKNRPQYRHNSSGFVGVSFHRATGKWMAHFGSDGKQYYLGLHDTPEQAAGARATAIQGHGFSQQHGKSQQARLDALS